MQLIGIESINGRLCSVLLLSMLTATSVQATSETMVGNMPVPQLDALLSKMDTQSSTSPQLETFRKTLRLSFALTQSLNPISAINCRST